MTQQEALNILKMGHNVYLTGEAGAGKTHVLNQYISWLKERGIRPAVTASTGIAATHLEGTTIHSWSGIGVREYITPMVLEQMEQKRSLFTRFQDTHVLVIDEISMLSGAFLDMCNAVARHLKRVQGIPFGGMQVVFSGDFFQLPPIEKGREEANYAFGSQAWQDLNPVICYITEQHRHGDGAFLDLLSAVRNCAVTEQHRACLSSRNNTLLSGKGGFLRLFTHNEDVDRINQERLSAIDAKEHTFSMVSRGRASVAESLQRGCLAPEVLSLKEGAEVMFVKNDPGGMYVNGTQGTVTGFPGGVPIVRTRGGRTVRAEPVSWKREEDGKVLAEITQVPLRLAWAVTVHKSQGMTLDEAEMDLSRCFVPGQGYVALSRVRSLEGVCLRGLNAMALEVDERVAQADVGFRRRSELAKTRLTALPAQELLERQKMFVTSRGGSWKAVQQEKEKQKKGSTLEKTRELLKEGLSLEKVAKKRKFALSTVVGHAEKLLEQGDEFDFSSYTPSPNILSLVKAAVAEHGFEKLSPVKRYLEEAGHRISYDQLRRIRLSVLSQTKPKKKEES